MGTEQVKTVFGISAGATKENGIKERLIQFYTEMRMTKRGKLLV